MYKLPPELRSELRDNIGEIIDEKQLKDKVKGKVVTVGDKVTLTLKNVGINPDICIVDFKSGRKKFSIAQKKKIKEIGDNVLSVVNPPESISRELWESVSRGYSSKKPTRIEVKGEEDMAALPAILLAPKNTTVIYGLPSKGIVLINVKEKEKEIVRDFLKRMEGENGN
jgi:uncharacterized protein (UPF0218 family)